MITREEIDTVMSSSIGTEQWYHRDYCEQLIYTDGVMYAQKRLNIYWLIDTLISFMPKIIEDNKKSDEWLYEVKLVVYSDHTALLKIFRELENFDEPFTVVEQNIAYTDLPECVIRFYLERVHQNGHTFCLLCPSEH